VVCFYVERHARQCHAFLIRFKGAHALFRKPLLHAIANLSASALVVIRRKRASDGGAAIITIRAARRKRTPFVTTHAVIRSQTTEPAAMVEFCTESTKPSGYLSL
jgi:hypothetical protein